MACLLAAAILLRTAFAGCPRQWNLNEKLAPPAGGWRGAVVDPDRFASVAAWERSYGYPLHIKRVFKGLRFAHLADDEVNFAKSGGIIFYTIAMTPPEKFTDYIGPQNVGKINTFSKVIGALAPHKVMVTVRYEPSLWTDPARPTKYLGSAAEYREMWKSFQEGFKAAKVTNVVWAMDYSTRATDEHYHPELAALWPGNIDWLLFNMFQFGRDAKRSWTDMFETAYFNFENRSGVPQTYDGKTYTADYKSAPYWGLGAWGADVGSGTEEKRSQYIAEAAGGFNSSRYGRLKTQVYFDVYDKNSGTGSIIRNGQKAAYNSLNGLEFFVQNDDCATPPQAKSEALVV